MTFVTGCHPNICGDRARLGRTPDGLPSSPSAAVFKAPFLSSCVPNSSFRQSAIGCSVLPNPQSAIRNCWVPLSGFMSFGFPDPR